MPGIGVRTASNIPLGIGGDIANFKSAAHLAAYVFCFNVCSTGSAVFFRSV
ncbi:transposase, partial [Bifidobacterium longum]|uniref:transposase n=1 Tax=Bifidobacterium longum TaxID=216816 RepID=UPI00398CEA15